MKFVKSLYEKSIKLLHNKYTIFLRICIILFFKIIDYDFITVFIICLIKEYIIRRNSTKSLTIFSKISMNLFLFCDVSYFYSVFFIVLHLLYIVLFFNKNLYSSLLNVRIQYSEYSILFA